jgi:lipid II:glycine glycyltransferase (peptidoglycan interpeptide bridge formation enzyme)
MGNYGDEAFFLGIYDQEKLVGGSIVIHVHARRGDFLYLPYGPILDLLHPKYFQKFIQELKQIAVKRGVVCIKVSPYLDENKENYQLFKSVDFRNSPLHILAETTWVLDITQTEEEILKNMRKNHRNLIRRAEKDGVTIRQSQEMKDLEKFIELHQETVVRHKFVPFSPKYIRKEFTAFQADNQVRVFLAEYEGKIISAAVIIFYGDTAVYRHGASASAYRKIPSSYLMLWEAILEAKKRGLKYFNFWGIAPDNNKKHPFAGITLFKTGFGGERKDLLHCQDLPVSKKYWLSWGVEMVRKVRRGF